jgi:hypothetical protein
MALENVVENGKTGVAKTWDQKRMEMEDVASRKVEKKARHDALMAEHARKKKDREGAQAAPRQPEWPPSDALLSWHANKKSKEAGPEASPGGLELQYVQPNHEWADSQYWHDWQDWQDWQMQSDAVVSSQAGGS